MASDPPGRAVDGDRRDPVPDPRAVRRPPPAASGPPSGSLAYADCCILCGMAYRAAVVGGSGYTGAELLRLLAGHPELEVGLVTAEANAGASVIDLFPSLAG